MLLVLLTLPDVTRVTRCYSRYPMLLTLLDVTSKGNKTTLFCALGFGISPKFYIFAWIMYNYVRYTRVRVHYHKPQ